MAQTSQSIIQTIPSIPIVDKSFLCTSLKILTFSGVDASRFLHSQLTIHIERLQENQACFGAYCNSKGRVITTLLVVKALDTHTKEPLFHLLVHSSVAEQLRKKLSMFILRSKVTITTEHYQLIGVSSTSSNDSEPFSVHPNFQPFKGTAVLCPSAGQVGSRWLVIEPLAASTDSPAEAEGLCKDWRTLDALSGYIWTQEIHVERFIPQTLNLDCIGAVHFDKGCYPGQEIVARTHYLGKVKRRTYAACLPFNPSPTLALSLPSAPDAIIEVIDSLVLELAEHTKWLLIETNISIPTEGLVLQADNTECMIYHLPIIYEKPTP